MISVQGLTRSYGDQFAVEQVSFEIGSGEIVGLLGPNGAGKTTIMKMLTGYLEPTAGSIVIDNCDLSRQRRAVQQRLGYLPENDPLYPEMTVIDYLDYAATLHGIPKAERPLRLREAIEQTDLQRHATDAISTLSRGYRQRVGVAQAIIHKPKVLILDEPTNGLDPTQVHHMRELIRLLAQQATVILSTHILQEVQAICDRVIIIRQGHKALDARLADLQVSRRLLVTIDARPQVALSLLQQVAGVDQVEMVPAADYGYQYALTLDSEQNQYDIAAQLAQQLAQADIALYALHPELRDLETIFGEISTQ
jgi:ABC-2 type transport system ATP-binding protein